MTMKAIFSCCFPVLEEKTNIELNDNNNLNLNLKDSIFSDEKNLDNSTRNENRNPKEKVEKITFEDHHRPKKYDLSPALQNAVTSAEVKSNKIFIEIPQQCSSKEKSFNTPKFSSEFQSNANNLKLMASPLVVVNNDETYSDYLVNQSIDMQIVKETPDVLLEELEGEQFDGRKLIINAAGLESSPRKSRDGFVFFGTTLEDSNHRMINDFRLKLNMKNKNEVNTESNRIFVLYFSLEKRKYFIRSYHNQMMSYLLIKLDSKYKIHNNEYIMIADTFFQLNIDKTQMLTIRKYATKKSSDETEHQFPNDYGTITIGRDKNCSISFPSNKQFSKVHTTFEYDTRMKCWFVIDGGEKASTIGTWLMPKHSYPIIDGTVFKLPGNSKFKVSLLYK